MPRTPTPQQEIDQLKKRYESLREKRIAADTELRHANQELDRLKEEAREKHGTDDLAELSAMLERMKQENEQKRQAYEEHLEQLEQRLAEVERQFADSTKAS